MHVTMHSYQMLGDACDTFFVNVILNLYDALWPSSLGWIHVSKVLTNSHRCVKIFIKID